MATNNCYHPLLKQTGGEKKNQATHLNWALVWLLKMYNMIIKQINKLSDFLNVITYDQVTRMGLTSPHSDPREIQSATFGQMGCTWFRNVIFLSPLLFPKRYLLREKTGRAVT